MIPICQYIAHLCQSEQKLEIGFNGTGTSNLTEAAARSWVDLGWCDWLPRANRKIYLNYLGSVSSK